MSLTMLNISDSTLVIALLTAVVGMVCYYIFRLLYNNLPPGPGGYPYIGIYGSLNDESHELFAHWAKKYGDILSFKLFGRNYIHLNTFEIIKEAFTLKGDAFNGRENEFSLVNFWDDGEGISQTEGKIWKEDRRFFLQNVKPFGLGRIELEPYIHDVTKLLLTTLAKTDSRPISAISPICLASLNVSGKVFYSVEYNGIDDPDFIHLTENSYSLMEEFIGPRMLLAGYLYKYVLFRWLSPNYHKLLRVKEIFYEEADKIIGDHKKTFDKNHIRDFTDRMLEEMYDRQSKDETTNPITHEKIRGLIVNIFVDGMLSTTNTFNGFLQKLAQNENVQREIQKEIDDVIGKDRLPSWTDRNNLPYTEAAILELHRTTTPFPLGVTHKCTETVQFHGYTIPKDSLVLSNIWSVHNNPKTWDNPEKCDPTRFLSGDEKKKRRESVVSFGIGKRFCIGEPLATMEMFIFLVSILQKFNITLPPGVMKEDKMGNVFDICFVPRELY